MDTLAIDLGVRRQRSVALALACAALVVFALGAAPPSAMALAPIEDIPGLVLAYPTQTGTLNTAAAYDNVYEFYLQQDEQVTFQLTGPVAGEFDLYLWDGTAQSVTGGVGLVASAKTAGSNELLTYTASEDGYHYVDVRVTSGSGSYTLKTTLSGVADDVIPGVPIGTSGRWGWMDTDWDWSDIYYLTLDAGDILKASVTKDTAYASADADFDLYVYPPGTLYANDDTWVAKATTLSNPETLAYRAGKSGRHYLEVYLDAGYGPYQLTWTRARYTKTALSTSSKTVGYASAASVKGTLSSKAGALAGKQVVLQSSKDGKTFADTSLKATTGATGGFSFSVKPTRKTWYRVRFAGTSTLAPSRSGAIFLYPRARLTRSTSWSTLEVMHLYYAKGYIEPQHTSGDVNKVKIKAYRKRSDGSYGYVKSFAASYSYYSSSKSRYKAAVKLPTRGAWKLVAFHAADSRNAATAGSPDYVTVK